MTNANLGSTTNPWRDLFALRPNVTYLNHGSFGPSPRPVLAARQAWIDRIQDDPVDFLMRNLEGFLDEARERLGAFVGTNGRHLMFVENATVGMNIVARSVPLQAGDEVLTTDHEYGAAVRIWRRRCQETGASLVVRKLPEKLGSADEVVETLFSAATPRTRLLMVSHVTSPTAVILPVQKICARAQELGIPTCIDGPHAPAAVPVEIDRLGCDFYTASCHKWLSAPIGSGFLYVHPRWQSRMEPAIVSWGRSLSGRPASWLDDFTWSGTRDPSAFLTVPAAIEFLEGVTANSETGATGGRGLTMLRERSHALVRRARERITEMTGLEPLVPDSSDWYGTMLSLPLPASVGEPPAGHYMHPLQQALWERHRIEVPVVNFQGRRFLRVSCFLYNDVRDVDRLVEALHDTLASLATDLHS